MRQEDLDRPSREEKLRQVMTNAIRSSDEMVAVVEEAKKQEAIAFGEWLLNEDIVEIWREDGQWLWKSTLYDINNKFYTTEELYNLFLKSK